ncbi:hypothetical protein ACU6TU_11425 [Halomonas sp. LS-001]
MLAFARWFMKGTPYAAGVAALATFMPWLYWLGAAIAGLVTLRSGFAPALPVIIATAVPAGWWWIQGDVIPLASVLLVTLMAVVLRERMHWGITLIAGTVVASVMVQMGIFSPPQGTEMMLEQLRQGSQEVDGMLTELTNQGYDPQTLATLVVGNVTGLVVFLSAIACLVLARSWQAGLYNPGGFRTEFHAFRLTPKELLVLFVIGVAGMLLGVYALAMLSWIPLLVAGIALIHGVIGLKGMNGLWLVAFYILLITTWPTILIVLLLGLMDTFANVRARLARSN